MGVQIGRGSMGKHKTKADFLESMPRDFTDIVWEIKLNKLELDWELFAIMAWSLWSNRNSICHRGKCKEVALIAREVTTYAKEVRQTNEVQSRPSPLGRQVWTPPRRGCYKVNVDGVVFKEMNCCGVGVVIRNEGGQIMGALSKRLDFPLKVLETEEKAVEEGSILARDLSLRNIYVESDAQVVVKSSNTQGQISSSIHKVIEGTKMELHGFDIWEVNHIYRAKNSAAHIMAKHAKFISDCCIWVEHPTGYYKSNSV